MLSQLYPKCHCQWGEERRQRVYWIFPCRIAGVWEIVQLLGLIRATREGNRSLHLSPLRGNVPWCFPYDNINYARYLSAYLSEMCHLPVEHPDAFKYVSSGGLSVQLSDSNPFGRVPVVQTCEETVNKNTQTSGGTKGFSLKPNAVSKYYLMAEYRSAFLRQPKGALSRHLAIL